MGDRRGDHGTEREMETEAAREAWEETVGDRQSKRHTAMETDNHTTKGARQADGAKCGERDRQTAGRQRARDIRREGEKGAETDKETDRDRQEQTHGAK